MYTQSVEPKLVQLKEKPQFVVFAIVFKNYINFCRVISFFYYINGFLSFEPKNIINTPKNIYKPCYKPTIKTLTVIPQPKLFIYF